MKLVVIKIEKSLKKNKIQKYNLKNLYIYTNVTEYLKLFNMLYDITWFGVAYA